MKLVFLILIGLFLYNDAFIASGFRNMHSKSLKMGGGRSKVEAGRSQRVMFEGLRKKLNEVAENPDFFDESYIEGSDVLLYCKSAKDGLQIGDCPFAQFVQMVLLKKGVPYIVKPTSSDNKPDWLQNEMGGKMPCLVHKDEKITDSLAIAEFLEKTYPHTTLTRQGVYSYQEVIEKTAGFFPAFAAWVKNKDTASDASLRSAFEDQLEILDEILRTSPGYYATGLEVTLADYYLTPQLFHASVALEHFKDYVFYHIDGVPTRPALENYMSKMFDLEEFNNKKAYYSVDQVINGWKTARGD